MIYGKHRTELLHGNQSRRLIMQTPDNESSLASDEIKIECFHHAPFLLIQWIPSSSMANASASATPIPDGWKNQTKL